MYCLNVAYRFSDKTILIKISNRNTYILFIVTVSPTCHTPGGYVEVAFRLSENYYKYAELFIQLYGNLFRLGRFDKIYEYFVGWDYNTCQASNSEDIKKWGGTFDQHLSACMDDPDAETYGLKAG
jgi:hypothetical protein